MTWSLKSFRMRITRWPIRERTRWCLAFMPCNAIGFCNTSRSATNQQFQCGAMGAISHESMLEALPDSAMADRRKPESPARNC